MNAQLKEQIAGSYLFSANIPYIEELYDTWLEQPDRVPAVWRAWFESIQSDNGHGPDVNHSRIAELLREQTSSVRPAARRGTLSASSSELIAKQAAVLRLIQAYRMLGHLRADVDPIRFRGFPPAPELDLHFQGLSERDLDMIFNTSTVHGPDEASLRDILAIMQGTYCGTIGSEFTHIRNIDRRQWVRERLERSRARALLKPQQRVEILRQLTAAETLERYLHTRYAGQKRFSLEGGDSLVPMLDTVIRCCGENQAEEISIGMAHRGRLNVLINIMGKKPADLFMDFEGHDISKIDKNQQRGDVKYHQGFSSDIALPSGHCHLSLAFNPSHLEIISPVVEGSVRARQDGRGDWQRTKVVPVLIHGDAALAGQGVVYETVNLSQTRGFSTGGTIHIVVNNQIGFTTSHPLDSRSTLYCTDVGKVVQAPIFHVNGDDPEAVIYVARLAVEYRMTFNSDVFIDMICYRRHGHNEADEPAATQPMMYKKIREHATPREIYADRLIKDGLLTREQADQMVKDYQAQLESGESVCFFPPSGVTNRYVRAWAPFLNRVWRQSFDTAVPIDRIQQIGEEITRIPEDVEMHPRVERVIADRRKMASGALPMDWGCAENLAYASLIHQGYAVRLTGQDSGRGTFFHRHAVVHNQRNGESYVSLQHLFEGQPWFTVVDSILSEEAVVGFEYGYSATDPETLVIWEAQFGDFANVAQVLFDQFISSSEQKWGRLSGITLMLPHGWEGQGPEHTSARLERFLQLCANDNMQVCVPSSPAQMFHLLRRQMIRLYRKPLVIMTPKSMLRRKISFSTVDDLASNGFQNVIGEVEALDPREVERVVLCSGKVYYDLLETRQEQENRKVAIFRVEQLYPFPEEELKHHLRIFRHARDVIWTQEEPMNQGAWFSIQHHIRAALWPHQALGFSGRLSSAAPSGGDYRLHAERQDKLVREALNTSPEGDQPLMIFEPKQVEPAAAVC